MRIDDYESFIDGFIEKSIIFGWFLISVVCTFFVIAMCVFMINNILIEISFVQAMWYIIPTSFVISLPITLFWFYYKKAKKIYHIQRLRDFWLGFASTVEVNRGEASNKDIQSWCKENLSHMHVISENHSDRFLFASKTDAVAFKLQWG